MRFFLLIALAFLLFGCIELSSNNLLPSMNNTSAGQIEETSPTQPSETSKEDFEVPTVAIQDNFIVDQSKLIDKLERNKNLFPNSVAKSGFFKGDEMAQEILSGHLKNYSISDFQGASENNRKTFAFKVLNALRMLGYKLNCDFGYFTCWHNFLKDNNLVESDVVSREALEKLDQQAAELELRDSTAAKRFPLYAEFTEENLYGEPSKNHLVALFANAYELLPLALVGDANSFRNFFAEQLPEGNSNDYAIKCNLQHQCIVSFKTSYYSSLTNENNTNNIFIIRNDFDFPAINLHEYGHYLDSNVRGTREPLKQGIINTTTFYAITFDLSTEFNHEIGWKYYLPRENFTGREAEFFVSEYAAGWVQENKPGFYTVYEDFAESFAMYVLAGNVFRCKAERHPVLMQKYNWLKENIFNGIEYSYEKAGQCNELYSNYQHYILNSPFSKFNLNEIKKVE